MTLFFWSCIFVSIILSYVPSSSFCYSTEQERITHQDTIGNDTMAVFRDTAAVSGVDTVITYTCKDSIIYSLSTKAMSLFSNGEISYQKMRLQSERIDINWNTSTLHAHGVPDTSDTTQKKFKGTPIMNDAGEEYRGHELDYNFQSKKGKIHIAQTEMDQGYYHGEEIKKIDKDVMFVAHGRYTTCDLPEPHYYFSSPKMKVILQDKVVSEPVYFYIADVPVFALPFGVFPNIGGRRSGIIAPAYGEDGTRGRFLRHLGYYWAMSDYMDMNLRTDLFTKGGWAAFSDFRYALRYSFSGSLSGEYKRMHSGEQSDPRRTEEESYRLNLIHNQDIDPTTRMNVNFTFTSNNSYLNTIDLRQALDQSIFSNATLSKSWEGTPNSISLNVARRQNLIDGSIDETLPSLNFNHSQSFPFRSKRKSFNDGSGISWYEMIGVGYSANAANTRSKVNRNISNIKLSIDGKDTVRTIEEYERNRRQSVSQNVSMSIAPKFGYVTLSPSMSYRDERSFSESEIPRQQETDSSLIFVNEKDAQRAGHFSSGLSASTKLYGIFQPGIFGIAALRHTLTPNLSFSYQKQIIGEDRAGKQMFMSLNIGNVFEMKTSTGKSEDGGEAEKIQLLNLGAGISYNFSADSLNFSPIGMNYRTSVGSLFDVGGDASFDLYSLVQVSPFESRRVNKFLINEEGRLARLTNFRISLSTSLSGEKSQSKSPKTTSDTLQVRQPQSGYTGLYQDEEPDFSIPWRLSLSLDYSENKVPPSRSRSSNVRGNLEFNLTENWKFTMSGGYDIVNREIVVPNINISRDLHCWIMNFSWVPMGTYRYYQLEIRVKAPQLQDVKVTKSGSERGIY